MAAILDVIRTAVRRETRALDDTELTPLIEAAKSDLAGAGVGVVDDSDPLTQAAIRLWCLWNIEKDPRQFEFYERIKAGMSMNSDYGGGADA